MSQRKIWKKAFLSPSWIQSAISVFFPFLEAITSEDGTNQAKASILRIMIEHSFSWNCRVYKALPTVEDIPLKLLWYFYDHFSLEKRTSKRFHVLCKVTKLRHKAMFMNVGLSPIPRQPMIQSMHNILFVSHTNLNSIPDFKFKETFHFSAAKLKPRNVKWCFWRKDCNWVISTEISVFQSLQFDE